MLWPRFAVAAFFLAALSASAADHPDFTGTWRRVDVSPSTMSSYTERIGMVDDRLRIERDGRDFRGSYRDEHVYAIGGPAETKKAPDGSERSVAVSWDGPHLVVLRTTTEGANTTTEREVWSLVDEGNLLFKDRRTTDWRGTSNERVVLKRSEGFYVYGVAGKSCRAWVSERGGPEGAASLQWILGYLTAYGVDRSVRITFGGYLSGPLRHTDAEEVGRIIDKYCGERHPDSDLWRAVDDLIRQLGGTMPSLPLPVMPVREYR